MGRELIAAGILGIAAVIPEQIIDNDYWKSMKFVDLPEGKDPFAGIQERRIFPQNILPSDIEAEAGRRALQAAAVLPDEIDLVLVQSMLQDELIPGNSCLVQHKLGLRNAGAWSVDTCCSSFVTMLVTAANLIATSEFKKVLIISSAYLSPLVDHSEYLCSFLGDGAGAVVMGPVSEGKGYIGSYCSSNGEYHKGFTLQIRQPYDYKRRHFMQSQEKPLLTFDYEVIKRVGRNSVTHMKQVLEKVLEKTNCKAEDIELFVSHQPCRWAHAAWRDSVGIPAERSYESFSRYGNIASASVPVNLFEAQEKGLLRHGAKVLLASSGAGENHIAAVLRWGR